MSLVAWLLCLSGFGVEPQYLWVFIFLATEWQGGGGTVMNSDGLYATSALLLYWFDFCPVIWKLGFSLVNTPAHPNRVSLEKPVWIELCRTYDQGLRANEKTNVNVFLQEKG